MWQNDQIMKSFVSWAFEFSSYFDVGVDALKDFMQVSEIFKFSS